jgi:uncharacterized membrane protein YjjP (DUF1212 family)
MEETTPQSSRQKINFILRLGRALHAHGYPAHRLEEVLEKAAERLGLHAQFFSTPTSMMVGFGPQDDQQTFLLRVKPGEVNLGKLAELDDVTIGVLRGAYDSVEGTRMIDRILAEPMEYGPWMRTLAYALASAAASRFLGGGWREILLSAFIGWVIGMLARYFERSTDLGRVFEPVAAFAASALASLLGLLLGPLAVSHTMLAGLIVLMPGLTLTVAMIELSTQHLSSGTSRLNNAFITFLAIGFGVAVGSSAVNLIIGPVPTVRPDPLPAWTMLPAILVMPLAFTILLRAHKSDAIWIVSAGVIAVGGSRLGDLLLGPQLGVFFGALLVGVFSSAYARWIDRPAVITQVPGILLLVPGSIGFRGLAAMLDEKVLSGIDTTFKMILTAVALVAGTLIASVIAPVRREI